MAMLEYLNCSFGDENYKKILTLREKDTKDEKAFHLSRVIGEDIIACGSLCEKEKGKYEKTKLIVEKIFRRKGRTLCSAFFVYM